MEDAASPLREAWYYAAPSQKVARGHTLARIDARRTDLCRPRSRRRRLCAARHLPASRNAARSAGTFDGDEIECCYHGWRFATDGHCTHIPSLVEGQSFDLARVGVARYRAREVQGNIWVFFGGDPDAAPGIPVLDGFAEPKRCRDLVETVRFEAAIDHAVVGLMDPAHGPFVHGAWWWRSRRSAYDKAKAFEPSPWGFTMSRHAPSANSRAYRLLGGAPETEILFRLPSVRVEEIRAGRYRVANLTALTPIDDKTTEINHCTYWTAPWLSLMKPVLRPYVRAFLRQDRDIMERQQQGLRGAPPLALIDDADTQARWYYRLKEEYRRARAEGRPFANPVKSRTLRWRS